MSASKVPITVRAEKQFRRDLQSKAKAQGISVQELVITFLERWLNAKADQETGIPTSNDGHGEVLQTGPEAEAGVLLHAIFEHGQPEQISSAVGALKAFAEATRSRHGKPRSRREA